MIVKECDIKDYVNEIIEYICLSEAPNTFTNCLEILTYKYDTTPRFKLEKIIEKIYSIVQEKSHDIKLMVRVVLIYGNMKNII